MAAAGRPEIVIVAAVADNGVIGVGDGLPWRLRSDMRHFRALTLGKPVVMGRRTFESLGRPLADRPNLVVSRRPVFAATGALVFLSLDDALVHAATLAQGAVGAREIAVIGGGEIYRQAMPFADRLEITEVHARPEGDVRFPPIDPATWRTAERHRHAPGENDDHAFTFVTYVRR